MSGMYVFSTHTKASVALMSLRAHIVFVGDPANRQCCPSTIGSGDWTGDTKGAIQAMGSR